MSEWIISFASSVYLWLYIQSVVNMDVSVWIYGYYILDLLNILSDGLTLFDIVSVLVAA